MADDKRKAVLRQSLSVGIATGAYGISFGALGVASGLSILQTVALSALLFSGGSQFALVGIIGAGGTGSAALATSTLLGVRNGLYGLQTSRILHARGLRRWAAAQLTIDESTAVAVGQDDRRAGSLGFWVTGAAVYVFWNLMTLVGALVGNALGDPQRWGLDAAAAAAFTALLWPRLRSRDAAATMVFAVAIALITSPLLPVGVPVILTVLAAVVIGLSGGGRHEAATEDPELDHHEELGPDDAGEVAR
ncbi:branched-chain amino acid ABC transporter permease [Knoellia subterranea KCTC 19937]|uniref:Branched-chain amino acid ABC transporter permease n=1 Tax=Knoellia subterranea KCTC 19937 TaxID=1385521 RepID=A0A0A0JQW7_9MICO|nr:branched-chain amino acid ABC transporter permease [Knoellia subterranea KCTC 19937]